MMASSPAAPFPADEPFLAAETSPSRSKNETSTRGSAFVATGTLPVAIPSNLPPRPVFARAPLASASFEVGTVLLNEVDRAGFDPVAAAAVPFLPAPVAFFPSAIALAPDFFKSPRALLPTPSTSSWMPCSSRVKLFLTSSTSANVFSNSPVRSELMRRKSRTHLPTCPASSGRRLGPKITIATTRTMNISWYPMPNMRGVSSLGETPAQSTKNETPWQNRGGSIAPGQRGDGRRGVLLVKIVVGLGNPGREYAATRHNLGFMVVDEFARRHTVGERRNRFRSDLFEVFDEGEKIVLLKPRTYMNLSGSAVREAVNWYKTSLDDLLVVVDDIDLPFTSIRLRARGGSGGHNGLNSIIAHLGSDSFPRLRIGLGRGPTHAPRTALSRFTSEEERVLPSVLEAAYDCALAWERDGIVIAMNRCNRAPESNNGSAPPIEDR